MDTPIVPGLGDDPQGDPAGQAVASLQGYVYQLYASALAWLDLRDDEVLYLEVAQDYATAAKNALKAIQVKNTQTSVTINSPSVIQAISDFVDLVERNPGRTIVLRYLATSKIGAERKMKDRAAGEPTLKYWAKAAVDADPGPLRTILERLKLTDAAKAYINERTNDQLRSDLLRRISWDCGAPGFEQIRQDLDDHVISVANKRLRVSPSAAKRAVGVILQYVLEKVVEPEPSKRKLTPAALLDLIEQATHVSIPQGGLETHVEAVVSKALALAQKPSLDVAPSLQFDIARDALERDFSSRYRQAQQRSFFPELQKQDQFQPLARQILDGQLVVLSEELRRRVLLRAARSAAVRGDLPAAERFLSATTTLRGSDSALPAQARLAEARGDIDTAIQVLRDEVDPDSRATLLSIIARARGVDAALSWLSDGKVEVLDLTVNGIIVVCNCYLDREVYPPLKDLLERLTEKHIEDCPFLLLLRGAVRFSSVLSKTEQHIALMGMQLDIRRVRPVAPDEKAAATLDAAIQDMGRLVPVLKELGLHETVRIAEDYIIWFGLLHPSLREAALKRLASDMQDPATAPKRTRFALAYLQGFDPEPILKHLQKRAAFGGLNEDELGAGLAILMDDHENMAPLVAFIAQHRDQLDDAFGKLSIRVIELQALARAGDATGARRLLEAHRDAIDPDEFSRLNAIVSTAEGSDPVTEFKRAYEASKSTESLRNLIGVLSQRDDHRSIGPYAEELFASTGDPLDLAFAARSYARGSDNDNFMRVVEAHNVILDLDTGLRRHYGWCLFRRGHLAEALAQARCLAKDAATRDLDLEVAIAIESGDWEALSQPLGAYLEAAQTMPAIALIRAAHLAQAAGQGPLKDLVSAALLKGGDDPNVLLGAYTVYVEEGLEVIENEAQQWFSRALTLSGPDGPVRQFELKDILEKQTEWNEHTRRIQEGIARGDIPLTVGVMGLRTTLVDVLLRNFTRNAALTDPRRKVVIPLFSGRRLPEAFGEVSRIALDFTALLVLGWLGLLPKVFNAFDEVVLPNGTFRDLFEGRRRIREFQKSRLRRAERIQQAIASGQIKIARSSLSRHDPLVVEVGPELAGLLYAAESANGVVLRPAPVHKPGLLNEEADVSSYVQTLADLRSLLKVLQDNGLTDQSTEEVARRYFELQDKGWEGSAHPDPGRPLYVEGLALIYLDYSGLLHVVLRAFPQVFIDSSTADDAAALVEYDNHTTEVLQVVDAIRKAVRTAQSAGKIVFGPQRPRRSDGLDRSDDVEAFTSSTLNLVADLALAEVAVIDDRGLNKEPFVLDGRGHRARAVTSLDVVEELGRRSLISPGEQRALRHRLRVAGAALVPLDTEEIVIGATRCTESDSAELRAMKESILLPRVSSLARFPSEVPWFATTTIAIKNAIMEIWRREPNHERAANLADATRSLQAQPEDWVDLWDDQVPPDWVNAVNRAILAGLALPVELHDEEVVQAYNHWVECNVLEPLRARAPETYDAVVVYVRSLINSVVKEDDG